MILGQLITCEACRDGSCCGCCPLGCVCWIHRDVSIGTLVKTCAFHTLDGSKQNLFHGFEKPIQDLFLQLQKKRTLVIDGNQDHAHVLVQAGLAEYADESTLYRPVLLLVE